MTALPFKTLYECSHGTSTDYVKLAFAHDTLTLNRDYIVHRFGKTAQTAMKEIHLVPFNDVSPDQLWGICHGQMYEGRASLLSRIKATLKAIILEKWVPGGHHAVLHSSGLDSRCISWLIRELAQEQGEDWLGTVVFCCSKWEAASFKGIMKYQGWDKDQYLVANEQYSDHDYYAPELTDFHGAWAWSDGAINIAVNLFWYPVIAAIEAGLLPDDQPIQTFTGQWGNTILDAGSSPNAVALIENANRMFYNSILCKRPMYGVEIVHPYAQVELAEVICESSITLGKKLRGIFCEYLDPTLAAYHNMASDGDRHRRIADWIVAQMVHDYKASWYGQHIKPHVRPAHRTTEFQDWYYYWTLASFCEELRRRGIEVR